MCKSFTLVIHLSAEKDKMLNVEADEYVYVHCSSDACHTFQTSHDKGLFIAVCYITRFFQRRRQCLGTECVKC